MSFVSLNRRQKMKAMTAIKNSSKRYFTNAALLVMMIIAAACSTPKVVVNYKANAEKAQLTGDYAAAAAAWSRYFNEQVASLDEIPGATFAEAAKTAYRAGNTQQAIEWFDQARYKDYADEKMYEILAEIYHNQDNLSKEMETLEFYTSRFGTENDTVNQRLFQIYYDINMNEKALSAWQALDDSLQDNLEMTDKYFQLNKKLGNTEIADSVSLELLEKDQDHVEALEWNAIKYYKLGEELYAREMKKYENNNTTGQYKRLLKQLDVVTNYFQKALTYFDKLWEINPGKEYAPYMANIYARFDEEKKAAYYRSFLDR